jgi:hypothetical protein
VFLIHYLELEAQEQNPLQEEVKSAVMLMTWEASRTDPWNCGFTLFTVLLTDIFRYLFLVHRIKMLAERSQYSSREEMK